MHSPSAASSQAIAGTAADEPAPSRRAATTNYPLAGRADGNTARGRRIRDLYRAYMRALGDPADTIVQADALAAAELKVACEDARTDPIMAIGDLIKLEGCADRAVRRLGIERKRDSVPAERPLQRYLRDRAEAAGGDGEAGP